MPRVFDNIDQTLLPALKQTLAVSERADFCVGYFNLRGWKSLDSLVDQWSGNDGECCRLLVGMQALPRKELEEAFNVGHSEDGIDNQTAIQKKRELAKDFRDQLMLGAPTNEDEAGHRQFTADPSKLRSPSRLEEGVYTEINLSANSLRDVIRNLLDVYEIPRDRLQVFLREVRDVARNFNSGGTPA
jgi:hypothetical protein